MASPDTCTSPPSDDNDALLVEQELPVAQFGASMLKKMGYDPSKRTTKPVMLKAWGSLAGLGSKRKLGGIDDATSHGKKHCDAVAPGQPVEKGAEQQPRGRFKCATDGEEQETLADELEVQVLPGISIRVLEADMSWQQQLVDVALDAAKGSAAVDPYGVVLWPSALVAARMVAEWAELQGRDKKSLRVLELGAGCGLVSLTAAHVGLSVLATDYRDQPLKLLREAAQRQGLLIDTALLDLRDPAPLPDADLVVASDVLYDDGTAHALARHLAEARARGSQILVTDLARSGAPVFMEDLRRLLPADEVPLAEWLPRPGVAVHGERHELFVDPRRRSAPGKNLLVNVLELPRPLQNVSSLH